MAPHAPSPSWCSIGGQRAPALEPARTLRRERPVLRTPCPKLANLPHCCFVTNAIEVASRDSRQRTSQGLFSATNRTHELLPLSSVPPPSLTHSERVK